MNHPINQQEWSEDSSEFDHPNIEKGTLKRLVRAKKQTEKEAKRRELNQIQSQLVERHTPEMEKRKLRLEEQLKPKLVETLNYTFENKPKEEDPNDAFIEQLLFLGSDPKIEHFIEFVENNTKLDLTQFCDFLYMNLAENIREEYDEAALSISKLILYFKHLQNGGIPLLKQMKDLFEDESKRNEFDNQCRQYFNESKASIMNLRK